MDNLENGNEKKKYNRKRVNRIKRVLLFFLVILFLFPTVLSVYLMGRLTVLEQKLDAISLKLDQGPTEGRVPETTVDLAKLDEEALSSLEMDTVQSVNLLAKSEEKLEKQTENNADAQLSSEIGAGAEKKAEGNTALGEVLENTEETVEEVTTEAIPLNNKTIYLTFDDGPSKNTEAILEILKEKDVKATFFVVVSDDSQKERLQMIKDAGHTIAIHSYSHKYHEIYSSLDSFKGDVEKAHDMIYSLVGVNTKFYRFPGGSSNDVSTVDINECIDYLDKAGYTYYDWNALNEDAEASYTTPEKLNENVLHYVHQNKGDSMVLLHDLENHSETVEALPALIDALRQEGYSFAAIDEKTKPVQHETVEGARRALKEKREKQKVDAERKDGDKNDIVENNNDKSDSEKKDSERK